MLRLIDDDDGVSLEGDQRGKKISSACTRSWPLIAVILVRSFEMTPKSCSSCFEGHPLEQRVVDDGDKCSPFSRWSTVRQSSVLPVPISPVMTTSGSRRSIA